MFRATKIRKGSRSLHRLAAAVVALPLLVVIATGLLLQLKKDWAWVQPPTARGAAPGEAPAIAFEEILAAARSVPRAGIERWADVDRLDVRPERGVVKVRGRSGWEVQVDTASGAVVQVARRRSDLIEALHDGSYFGGWAKLGVFLPAGLLLLVLWLSGVYLYAAAVASRRRSRRKTRERRRIGQLPPEPPSAAPATASPASSSSASS